MYCVIRTCYDEENRAMSVCDCEEISPERHDELLDAMGKVNKIVSIDVAHAMVRDAMVELNDYCAKYAQYSETQGVCESIFKAERRVRAALFEFRAYEEHIRSLLKGNCRKRFNAEIDRIKNGNPVFYFVWELRNYAAHFASVVESIERDADGVSHPMVTATKILKYKGQKGKSWATASKQYINTCGPRMDLLDALNDAFRLLRDLHEFTIKDNLRQSDALVSIETLHEFGKEIMARYGVPRQEMWQYSFGDVTYTDDGSHVSYEEFHHPTNNRGRGFTIRALVWPAIFDIMSIHDPTR